MYRQGIKSWWILSSSWFNFRLEVQLVTTIYCPWKNIFIRLLLSCKRHLERTMNQPQQCTKCGSCLELRDETEISSSFLHYQPRTSYTLCAPYTYRKAIKVFIPAIFQPKPTGFHLLDYHTARSYLASKLGCTRHNTRKSGLWVCGHAQLLHSAAWCATSEPSVSLILSFSLFEGNKIWKVQRSLHTSFSWRSWTFIPQIPQQLLWKMSRSIL